MDRGEGYKIERSIADLEFLPRLSILIHHAPTDRESKHEVL